MSLIKIERFFTEKEALKIYNVASFYTPIEVAKGTGLNYVNTVRELKVMCEKGILVRHSFKAAYRINKEYYQKNCLIDSGAHA
jgi:hypothetical protein